MTHNTSYRDGAPAGRIERAARLRWVPLTRMRVNPLAQRELRPARVSRLAAEFDVEQMGTPTVSHRGAWYYLIDGQLPEQLAIKRLSSTHGGVSGLLSRAGHLRQQTGDAQAQCVAAAAVEAINRGTGGKKLPSWWKAEP